MRLVMRLILAIVLLVALTAILLDVNAMDYLHYWISGIQEAKQDIQRGHLEIRGYGLPARCTPDYAHLLKDRLGVSYAHVAGCSVSAPLQRHTYEYNEVMTREIEHQFGAGVMERLFDEAS